MTLLGLIIAVLLFACLYWLVNRLPIDPSVKRIVIIVLLVVAIIVVLYWLLGASGLVLNTRVTR